MVLQVVTPSHEKSMETSWANAGAEIVKNSSLATVLRNFMWPSHPLVGGPFQHRVAASPTPPFRRGDKFNDTKIDARSAVRLITVAALAGAADARPTIAAPLRGVDSINARQSRV